MNVRPAVLACVVFVIGWVARLPAQEPAKELAWKYHEPFQGTPRQAKDFEFLFGIKQGAFTRVPPNNKSGN